MVPCCLWWRPRPKSPSTADRTADAPALLAWRERLDGLGLSSKDKDALIRLLLAMQPADREVVVITDVQMVADALRRHPAAGEHCASVAGCWSRLRRAVSGYESRFEFTGADARWLQQHAGRAQAQQDQVGRQAQQVNGRAQAQLV